MTSKIIKVSDGKLLLTSIRKQQATPSEELLIFAITARLQLLGMIMRGMFGAMFKDVSLGDGVYLTNLVRNDLLGLNPRQKPGDKRTASAMVAA